MANDYHIGGEGVMLHLRKFYYVFNVTSQVGDWYWRIGEEGAHPLENQRRGVGGELVKEIYVGV